MRFICQVLYSVFLICWITLAFGAEGNSGYEEISAPTRAIWNFVIAILVISISAGSAALPIAAIKQWHGNWRISAIIPIAVLVLLIVIIVTAQIGNPQSHRLWSLEIFAWAMLNMVYMVAVMTIKRILEKEDDKNSSYD